MIRMMISNHGRKNKEKGYVLIDVLITLMILSIVMTSVLAGYAMLGSMVGDSWNRIKTMIDTRNEIDKMQRIPK